MDDKHLRQDQGVAQVSKFATGRIRRGGPAVSPISKSAGDVSRCKVRVQKPAIQRTCSPRRIRPVAEKSALLSVALRTTLGSHI
ncbi:MAG: hypothetical protein DME33_10880 [Verrucomicrobia bacterium]|nr:MAG: hypothetical protein DME33_10880 [Verrucomicrobiota bacterium]